MMRSSSPARSRTSRRTAPIATSIHWEPLRDPHYVLVSLQRDQGGHRQIFAKQSVLARLSSLVRSGSGHPLGVLLGHLHDCPETGTRYVLIEALGEAAS